MDAPAVPHRAAICQRDVAHRARPAALAAAGAGGGGEKGLVPDKKPVKHSVHRTGKHLSRRAALYSGQAFPCQHGGDGLLQPPVGFFADNGSRPVIGHRKHGHIVFRHHQRQKSPEGQALLGAQGPQVLFRAAHAAAAGHDEIGVPAAGKAAVPDQLGKHPGQLPGIGGRDKDPGLFRGQRQGLFVPDGGNAVRKGVLQPGRQQLGRPAAVAGAGEINDHACSFLQAGSPPTTVSTGPAVRMASGGQVKRSVSSTARSAR